MIEVNFVESDATARSATTILSLGCTLSRRNSLSAAVLGRLLKRLESGEVREIAKRFGNSPEWVFIGCGSSYYIALAAAAT